MVAAERLVLRLEPRTLDLPTVLPLLRRHRLHSALLAVRASRGDHVSSVEEVSMIYCGEQELNAGRAGGRVLHALPVLPLATQEHPVT